VAGFDFEFAATPRQREFAGILLRQAQKLAARRGLALKYRWSDDNHYYATVDGPLIDMQVLVPMLITTMMVCTSTTASILSRNQLRRLASRVIHGYLDGLRGIEELVGDVCERLRAQPNSLAFDVGRSTHLSGKMGTFSDALVLYCEGRLRPDQIVEESHTILELLLKNALKTKSRKESFESMLNIAVDRGILRSDERRPLTELKKLRRSSKHKGQSISEEAVQDVTWDSVAACHRLLQHIRK